MPKFTSEEVREECKEWLARGDSRPREMLSQFAELLEKIRAIQFAMQKNIYEDTGVVFPEGVMLDELFWDCVRDRLEIDDKAAGLE